MAALSRLTGTSAEADQPIKPGVVTTEFAAWFVTNLGSLLTLLGVFDIHGDARVNAWVRVAALIASAFSTGLYAHSRSAVKSAVALNRSLGATPGRTEV